MKPRHVVALLTLGLCATTAFAEGTLDKIRASGTITLGHRDASIPFSYLDDKQQPIGYAMDLCLKVVDAVKAAGYRYVTVDLEGFRSGNLNL